MDAITDDYYDEINLKTLLAEYQRAKVEKKEVRKVLNKMIEDQDSKNQHRIVLHSYINQMLNKETLLVSKIQGLCELLGTTETNIYKRIHILKKHEPILLTLKHNRMKSKVQTYDLRDCEEY